MPEDGQDQTEQPKIIVDDDWKAQAQAEKERLAHEMDAEPAAADAPEGAAQPGEAGAEGAERGVPPASFAILVNSLLTQTFFALGAIADPQSGKRYVDLSLAKHHIDMLGVLEEKTKGNLTEDETKMLDRAIYEGRMQYVQTAQSVQ